LTVDRIVRSELDARLFEESGNRRAGVGLAVEGPGMVAIGEARRGRTNGTQLGSIEPLNEALWRRISPSHDQRLAHR
jgi:hypothetical protein